MALVAQGDESLALPGRRGRRLSASREPWEEMSMALFRRLDPAATGLVHQDQLQCIWPTLTQHVEGVPRELKAQRRQRSAQVSTTEWQSLMAALCAVVGARRFKSSMRRADVVISKGLQSPRTAPLASSVSLPLYDPVPTCPARTLLSSVETAAPAPEAPQESVAASAPTTEPKPPAQASAAPPPALPPAAAKAEIGGAPDAAKETAAPAPPRNEVLAAEVETQSGKQLPRPEEAPKDVQSAAQAAATAQVAEEVVPQAPTSATSSPKASKTEPGSPQSPQSPQSPAARDAVSREAPKPSAAGEGPEAAPASPQAAPREAQEAVTSSVPVVESPSEETRSGKPPAAAEGQPSPVEDVGSPSNASPGAVHQEPGSPAATTPAPASSPKAQAAAASKEENTSPADALMDTEAPPLPLDLNAAAEEGEEQAETTEAAAAIALIPIPKKEAAAVVHIAEMPSADAAEAEAFARRFRRLRAAEEETQQQRSTCSLAKLVDDDAQGNDEDEKHHEVMGVNARILQEVRTSPAGAEDLERVEFNLAEPSGPRKRQVWDHRGNTVMSWNEDLDEVTASRSKGASEYRRDAPQATESQSLGLGSRELPSVASGGQSSQGSVRLPKIDPKLSRAHTAPSGVRLEDSTEESLPLKDSIQSALESSSVKALRERLRSEMTLHEQTRAHAQELERRLQLATSRKRDLRASSEDKPRFGISSGAPYTAKAAKTEKEKRSIVLPPLRTPKPSVQSRRLGDPVGPVVQDMLKEERMSALSRQEQSRTRVQAFGKLGHAGLSTWDVRLDEKVSRFQDMRAFSESMWNSFYDWNSQYQTLG